MSVVAVAGGLGDVGRTIVEEILRSKKHKVYILTRKTTAGSAPREYPSHFPSPVEVDYASVHKITQCLQRLQIDTVISALNLHWAGVSGSQINLIRGAAASGIVARFIPSEFNIDYHAPPEYMPYGPRNRFLRAEYELDSHSNMTYTLVRCGFFMDYLGLPYAVTNLHPLYCLVDVSASKAVIPGDGTNHVVFTHTRDVGKFVTELLSLEATKWPREATISGERITLNDLVTLTERVIGKQFDKCHESLENMKANIVNELPSNRLCYPYFSGDKDELNSVICPQMIGMVSGVFDIQGIELTKVFPDIGVIRLEDFLSECWNNAVE